MPDTPAAQTHPYDALTPDLILDAVEQTGLRCDGRLAALNSYENRVYQVGVEDAIPVIAKFYRPQRWPREAILEEHAFALELYAAELPVVPPLRNVEISGSAQRNEETDRAPARSGETNGPSLRNEKANGLPMPNVEVNGSPLRKNSGQDDGLGTTLYERGGFLFAVYPRQRGRAPELEDRETLEWMGRFIGRIHAIGALHGFKQRPALDLRTFGEEPYAFLIEQGVVPPDLRTAYQTLVRQVLDQARGCFERAGNFAQIRLHGDCHAGNVLWDDDGPHFVDLDDARAGPAVQDLWMLLSGERETMEPQLAAVLRGYREFHDFNLHELHLVEALRTLRLIHYAGWLARRWDDPTFPINFPWFGTQRYWQDQILALREQSALMNEPPLALPPE